MAYTLDMSNRTIEAAERPASRSAKAPDPNPLLDSVKETLADDKWLVLRGVPTAATVVVDTPGKGAGKKISEAEVVVRMLRRAARTLDCGVDITQEPAAKKGQVDVFFHARARRERKVKGTE